MNNMLKNNRLYFFILIILLTPSVYSLLLPGFFQSDDGGWMVIRFSAFYQAFSDGQFPVRFLGRLNFGYGYPVANFLYPGFMYLATPLQVLGLGFVNSIKIILIISMVGGGVFTFAWLSKIFDKTSALVGTVFYTYTPYHLFDLYKRGSVGELLSLMWISFVLFAIEKRNKFLISIGIFLLAISHNSLFLLFLPLLFVYTIIRDRVRVKDYLISFGLGILMSSFFTIPAILELSYTNFSKIKISDFSQYFASLELVGISSIIVLVFSLAMLITKRFKEKKVVYFFVLVSVLAISLSLSISEFLWGIIPSSLIQFPFRLLSYLIISLSFLSAYIAAKTHKLRTPIAIVLLSIAFLTSINFLSPKLKFDKGDSFYSTNEATTTVKDEYMPKWVLKNPTSHFNQKVEILDDAILASNLTYNSKNISFKVSSDKPVTARINTIYYPGWEAKINQEKINIKFDNPKGIMELSLPAGKNIVELNFTETPLRLLSDLISVFAFAVLVLWGREDLLNNRLIRRIK